MMELLLIGTLLALLSCFILMASWRHARQWSEVAITRGDRPDQIFATYQRLKACGVRCRMRQVGASASWFMMGGPTSNISLLVHEGDADRARPLVLGRR